jgi:hypothetical protein
MSVSRGFFIQIISDYLFNLHAKTSGDANFRGRKNSWISLLKKTIKFKCHPGNEADRIDTLPPAMRMNDMRTSKFYI